MNTRRLHLPVLFSLRGGGNAPQQKIYRLVLDRFPERAAAQRAVSSKKVSSDAKQVDPAIGWGAREV